MPELTAPQPPEGVDAGFNRFWEAYPKKTAKKKSQQIWKRLKPSEALTEKIISHVLSSKGSAQWSKDSGEFVPFPSTYLNQERWNDEVVIVAAPVAAVDRRALLANAAKQCEICHGQAWIDLEDGSKGLCSCQKSL